MEVFYSKLKQKFSLLRALIYEHSIWSYIKFITGFQNWLLCSQAFHRTTDLENSVNLTGKNLVQITFIVKVEDYANNKRIPSLQNLTKIKQPFNQKFPGDCFPQYLSRFDLYCYILCFSCHHKIFTNPFTFSFYCSHLM